MGFFDEIKRLAHPYDDEDEFFDRGGPEEEQPGPPITASPTASSRAGR